MDATALWRRPAVIVAAALAVVAVATVAALAVATRGGGPHSGLPPPLPPTRELLIGKVRVGAFAGSPGFGTALLDPRTRTYRKYQEEGRISPDGRRAVLWRDGLAPGLTSVTLLDLTTGQRRPLSPPRPAEGFTWSPDGTAILGTVVSGEAEGAASGSGKRIGFVVLRPDTGASSYVAVDQDSCASEDLGDFGWNAGGAEVFAMTGGSQESFRPCSITYFGLDGRPHRTLDGARGEMAVIDTTTGAPVGRIGAGDKAPTPVGWTDTGHVLAVQRCGHDGGRLAVLDLAGHLTRTVTACGHPEGFPQLIRAAS